MLTIGLTGGIASGKSSVTRRFAELGAPIVDSDRLAREVVEKGSEGLAVLVAAFDTSILSEDGTLDRTVLRERIFDSEKDRNTVNAILHPLIRARGDAETESARDRGHTYLIHDIPLLVETGQQDRFDRILVVDLAPEVQLARLIAREGMQEAKARSIIAAQASNEERLAIADDVIDNNGGRAALLAQVDVLHARYVELAEGKAGAASSQT